MSTKLRYIGLMSGTSADGIDLALVEFDADGDSQQANGAHLVASYYQAYDIDTHHKITALYTPTSNEIDRAFSLDVALAHQFAQAIKCFLQQQHLSPSDINAIGCHGQTIRHRPSASANNTALDAAFTLQIGCHQTLAVLTGIRVIGDFRTKDLALGGQGAPLVPAFHQAVFSSPEQDVFVVNIGGIANITFLPQSTTKNVCGFDTGPGNALMDYWFQCHQNGRYDKNGAWANSGVVSTVLLQQMLAEPYFALPAPKSTGREYFNQQWLAAFIADSHLSAVDIQATLTALTARTISDQIKQLSTKSTVYLCGGGVRNSTLVSQIKQELSQHELVNSHTKNINSDSLEAMAFAWLALAFDKNIVGNIPSATGASKEAVLGINFNP